MQTFYQYLKKTHKNKSDIERKSNPFCHESTDQGQPSPILNLKVNQS